MLAYRLLKEQTQPEFQDVPDPHAGPGQVVIKVAGSGLCHTDFTVIAREPGYWKNEAPPLSGVKQAYDDFKQGHLVGRAVLIPEASAARAAVTSEFL